jgi:hypothetical protein
MYKWYKDRVRNCHAGSTNWQRFILSFITPPYWRETILLHDMRYRNSKTKRLDDDNEMFINFIIKTPNKKVLAYLYFIGVRFFGKKYKKGTQ